MTATTRQLGRKGTGLDVTGGSAVTSPDGATKTSTFPCWGTSSAAVAIGAHGDRPVEAIFSVSAIGSYQHRTAHTDPESTSNPTGQQCRRRADSAGTRQTRERRVGCLIQQTSGCPPPCLQQNAARVTVELTHPRVPGQRAGSKAAKAPNKRATCKSTVVPYRTLPGRSRLKYVPTLPRTVNFLDVTSALSHGPRRVGSDGTLTLGD